MAKLFKQAFSNFSAGPRTHDEDDLAMRECGATGVFRNLAFQESPRDICSTKAGVPGSPTSCKKAIATATTCHDSLYSAEPSSPTCRDTARCSEMWASPPPTPSTVSSQRRTSQQGGLVPPSPSGKHTSFPSACPTPKSHRLSILKLPHSKTITEVEEIAARDLNLKDDPAIQEEDAKQQQGISVSAAPLALGSPVRAVVSNSVRVWEDEVKRLILAGRIEDAVRFAAPSDGMIRCTVRRVKNFMGQTLSYQLFLDSSDMFLLAARKRKKSTSSNFVLSTNQDDLGRDSDHRIAKLRANFVGTEYSLMSRSTSGAGTASSAAITGAATAHGPVGGVVEATNSGATPGEASASGRHDSFSQEEMAVHYKQTVLTTKGGPRVMLIATPLPDSNWCPAAADGPDSLTSCLEAARRRELPPRLERQLCMLATRPPEWDPALKAYTLDFQGRVRASSVKNFQLVHWDHNNDRKGSDLVLQFGKKDERTEDFALDFTYPLTLQKAFGIALASTDSKLCYAI